MANQWFRMYAEFATDAKVQMMSEQYQRRLMMLFCLRCNGDVTLHDDEVAFQLRIGNVEWAETKREFIARGFIDEANNLLNWDKRQYRSDSSAERVARHRKAKRNDDVTICNVTVTAPDTEQIQIQNRKKKTKQKNELVKSEIFMQAWDAFPSRRKGNQDDALRAWHAAMERGAKESQALASVKAYAVSDEATSENGKYAKGFAAWLNADRWNDAIPVAVALRKDAPLAPDGLPIGWMPTKADYEFAQKMVKAGVNASRHQAQIARYEAQNATQH